MQWHLPRAVHGEIKTKHHPVGPPDLSYVFTIRIPENDRFVVVDG